MSDDPHELGRQAFRAGKSGNAKPWSITTPEGRAWSDGWMDEQLDHARRTSTRKSREDTMAKSKEQHNDDLPEIDLEGMQADLTGWLVDRLRHLPKPYPELSEAEQKEVIESAQKATADLLREVVKKIAADERKVIVATLKNVTRDADKIVGKLECATSSEYRHEMFDATNQQVLMVVADADKYLGGEMPEAEPDQRTIDDYDKQSAH